MAASVVSSKSKWKEFFTRYYKSDIQQLAVSDARSKSLTIDFQDIVKFDVRLSEELINNSGKVIKDAEDALPLVDLPVKRKVSAFVRIIHIPRKTQVRDLRSDHINTLISIDGTVRKITDVRPRIIVAAFECARCGNVVYLPQEGTGKFLEPSYCTCNEEKKGVFRLMFKESTFEDYQRVKIQESPEDLKGGEQPQTLDINVNNDLSGVVTPGERVVVNGILRSVQKINKDGKTVYFDIYVDCNSLELEEQEFDELEITPEDEEAIVKLAKASEARIMVDDAHGIGVLGKGGRGTAEHFNLENEVDLIMGTYSKSLAAIGGFVAGSYEAINFIKHVGRSMIFSASLPPVLVATVSEALDIIDEQPQLRETLWRNTHKMLKGYKALGFDTGDSETPIIPIIIKDSLKVYQMCRRLFEHGVFVNPVVNPAVPPGRELLRTSCMATHTEEQLDRVLHAFEKVGKELGVIYHGMRWNDL
jgi:hypothetical protein